MKPLDLRFEHGPRLLGVTERAPRLSWRLPPGTGTQRAYRIRSDAWDSGEIESDRTTYVPYDGPPLASRQVVTWQVQVWTDDGESDWSDPAQWEMGLLEPADWTASFIAPAEAEVAPPGFRPAQRLRTTFELAAPAATGRIYATAHGLYELFLDDTRVGDLELTPGFTAYRAHLEVQTYDITSSLGAGTHTLEAVLSDGWWRGQVGFTREHDTYGRQTALLVQLEAKLQDGSSVTVGTDRSWESALSAITAADLIEGQREDHRIIPGPWMPVRSVDADLRRLTSSPAPPTRRIEELVPASISTVGDGSHVVDLGQNINGWLRLRRLGPEGTTVRLTHAERLRADGTVDLDHLKPFDFLTREPLSPGQVDEVIAAGTGEEAFEPRHTTHGFQFAQLDGLPGAPRPEDVRGVVVHTDLRRTGWFSCSDERINALHEAAVWSFRGNACEVPTDCPQRERAGWTGDWQLFAPTAAYLYDVAGFSARWLRDLAADQWPDGRVPNFVPDPAGPAAHDHPVARFMTGSSGWGDASVLVPWEMWVAYGDLRFLERSYDAATRWVEFAERAAIDGRHASRRTARAEPGAHERFLWDSGFHWGEWCEPGGNPEGLFTLELDVAEVATAYLHRSAATMRDIAEVLGRAADQRRWSTLADDVLDAWRTEFIGPDGSLRPDTQANHVRALAFGLVPDELRAQTARRLVELIREANTHLGTGFLATPFLLPVLADTGHTDVAFELLFQDTPPSWLSMIDAGATTIWENWEGIDADGLGSLNHYSKGAVISFLHRYVAGLRPDQSAPGYRHFRVEPVPGGGITSANARLDAPRGTIAVAWTVVAERFQLDVTVPPGSTATVLLPDGHEEVVGPGVHHLQCATTGV